MAVLELHKMTDLVGRAAIDDPGETTQCKGCAKLTPWTHAYVLVDSASGTCDPLCGACVSKRRLWSRRVA